MSKPVATGLISRVEILSRSVRTWVVLCLIWAAIIAWSHRREMDPDGFSYLQMAARAANGDLSALNNSYWSPGYPAMLAVLLAVFRPAPETAFAVAHLLNFFLFIAATAAFVYFLRNWNRIIAGYDWLLIPLGFVLFLKFGIDWMGVHGCTPDLAVGVVVLLAAAIICKLSREPFRLALPLLGFVLASGYYVKSVMFPLSLLCLALLFLFPPSPSVSRISVLLAMLTFAVACAPLITAQSRLAGHFTFSEIGGLAYAWYTNGIKGVHRGGPVDPRAHLVHPPRRLTETPLTLEFATPVQATYPIWYNPVYWSQGIRPSFNLKQQIASTKITLLTYGQMAMEISVLIAAAIVLLAANSEGIWPLDRRSFWIVAWPLSALALYSLVHVEWRFFGAFMIVMWMGILSAGLRSTRIVSRGAIVALIGLTLLLPTTFRLVLASGRTLSNLVHPVPTIDILTARALKNAGLRDGDGIAVIGETFEPYYAWIAKVNVVAQVPDQDELWRLSAADFNAWLATVARSGAKALVAMDRPAYANRVQWQDIPASSEHSSTIGGSAPHQFSIYVLK